MDNSIGPQAEKAMAFADGLKKRFDVAVEYIDERLTTSRSTQILIESGVRRENRKQFVDQLAAVQILQTYIDRERRQV
jgi:putative Holliday junction resolvase